MVNYLLEYGADVNCARDKYRCPVGAAARNGHEEVVSVLLANGASTPRALENAAAAGQVRLVQRLVIRYRRLPREQNKQGVEVGRIALANAITSKNPAVISLLLDAGVPLNEGYPVEYDDLPIVLARTRAADWVVEYLLSLGAEDREIDPYVNKDNEELDNTHINTVYSVTELEPPHGTTGIKITDMAAEIDGQRLTEYCDQANGETADEVDETANRVWLYKMENYFLNYDHDLKYVVEVPFGSARGE
ncbi:Uu.00g093680.m01.CDS01 [Anthostomella pinea]|uniref:Uu.00g093680.m01.CDS01 n=1 Tax=Anthostomella pinea TaxID=933095 RepID=A0AAI8VP63_9PEZI|nr:Uu.00g093680.m01.CDS01 [Anthostomella pinea]